MKSTFLRVERRKALCKNLWRIRREALSGDNGSVDAGTVICHKTTWIYDSSSKTLTIDTSLSIYQNPLTTCKILLYAQLRPNPSVERHLDSAFCSKKDPEKPCCTPINNLTLISSFPMDLGSRVLLAFEPACNFRAARHTRLSNGGWWVTKFLTWNKADR